MQNTKISQQQLLLISPMLLLAIPGWIPYWRQARRECILTTAVFLVYLLLFARHRTSHGFTADSRYLAPFLSLLAIPIGFFFEWLFSLRRRPVWQALLLFVSYGLFFISVRNVIYHIGLSYNYNLELSQLDPMITHPANWQYLATQVFRNVANLPYLWLLEMFLFALLFFLRWLFSRRSSRQKIS